MPGERVADAGAGRIVTLFAPAPLSVSGLVIVRPLREPAWLGLLLPDVGVDCSKYRPGQTTTVSHGAAWSTAAWIDVKAAFGQSALSSSTVQVDAHGGGRGERRDHRGGHHGAERGTEFM